MDVYLVKQPDGATCEYMLNTLRSVYLSGRVRGDWLARKSSEAVWRPLREVINEAGVLPAPSELSFLRYRASYRTANGACSAGKNLKLLSLAVLVLWVVASILAVSWFNVFTSGLLPLLSLLWPALLLYLAGILFAVIGHHLRLRTDDAVGAASDLDEVHRSELLLLSTPDLV